MRYVIHSMGMPFNGDTIKTQGLGGSETAAYYHARELARRGHDVVVFTNTKEQGKFDGVTYCNAGEATQHAPLGQDFAQYACNTPHDVLIIQRHPMAFHKDYASKINVLQLHDISLRRSAGAFNAGAARIDIVTGVSQWHVNQIKQVYGFHDRIMRVVPNGVDLDLYNYDPTSLTDPINALLDAERAGELCYLYQSRPERGLEHLVRPGGIMEALLDKGSRAHLFVCGYDYTTNEMRPYYDYLNACCDKLPNVTRLGSLTKPVLAQVQMRCDALVYPTEFEEVSCITAMEAMAAGLPFISSDCAALPETCKDSGSILIPLKLGVADEEAFISELLNFESDASSQLHLQDQQLAAAESRTWEDAVDALEDAVEEKIRFRAGSAARVSRHLIEHSDISALDYFSERGTPMEVRPSNAIHARAIDERNGMYAFTESLEATKEHYSKWEGMNCDRMAASGMTPESEREGVLRTTRYAAIAHLVSVAIAEKINSGVPVRVLEFGCAHGHITCLLAESFPTVKFVGMDFMDRSIELARETAKARKLYNVEFQVGSLDAMHTLDKFDVVVAPEVVEHIMNYTGAIDDLLGAVAVNGHLILTTPVGRWEWSGRHWWHKGREHLHHFERSDLETMFAEFPHTILHAPSGSDPGGEALGSWVTSVQKTPGASWHDRDYTEKLATTVPRDTVSLCMIVKDAGQCIERLLRSVCNVVDEVVIALDNTTTDNTRARIDEVAADFPHITWKVFDAESPLKIGFDEARNATIDASCGDWILWLDADEEVVGADNLLRLLRPAAFDGYAIPQHHLSRNPPQVIAVDHPTRLFRRDSGARFYGVVHEHPEVEIGKAIPHTFGLSDAYIVHHGYHDEATRRGRYMRNFPLLLRDLEKHPNRKINKFLYIRDLAQSIAFEGEQIGGVSEGMRSKAHEVCDIFYKMIDDNPMLRMTLDALPYYTTAVATIAPASAFHATIRMETKKDELPGIKAAVNAEALFHNRETYNKLLARIAQETTVNYDPKYL